jgi:hypothetical protein
VLFSIRFSVSKKRWYSTGYSCLRNNKLTMVRYKIWFQFLWINLIIAPSPTLPHKREGSLCNGKSMNMYFRVHGFRICKRCCRNSIFQKEMESFNSKKAESKCLDSALILP